MKTIEFPLYLSPSQQEQVSEWMEILAHVYNRAIALCEWRQYYLRLEKVKAALGEDIGDIHPTALNVSKVEVKNDDGKIISSEWAISSPCTVQARIDKTKSWDEGNIDTRPCCHLVKSHWLQEPLITGYSPIDLRKPFAKSRYDVGDIPQVYTNDYLGSVAAKAWADYQDPNRPELRRPRYKSKRDRVNTIPCGSYRAMVSHDFSTDTIKLPGLDSIHIPALSARLGSVMDRMRGAMAANPENYPELDKRLAEREAFLQVARWLDQGQPLPEEPEGDIKKAIKSATAVLDKTGEISQAIAKLQELADKRELSRAIDHLTCPGAFNLCRRGQKFYLQIVVRNVWNRGNPRAEPIGLDLGFNLMADTTNGVTIRHPDLSHLTTKVNRLKQKQAAMKIGSKNWHRIQEKIGKIERQKTKSKRSRQHYIAGWLVDANQNIAIKKFDPKVAIGRPVPVPKTDAEGYQKNGREEQRAINEAIRNAALGQLVDLIKAKAKDRGGDRVIELVKCAPGATPREVLEASGLNSGDPQSEPAQNPTGDAQSLPKGTREDDAVTTTTRGESSGDSPAIIVSPAETPRPYRRKKRSPARERRVV